QQTMARNGEHDRSEDLLPRRADLPRETRMPTDARGIPDADGHSQPDQLVRLAVGRRDRVELRQVRVLRGMQLREDLAERLPRSGGVLGIMLVSEHDRDATCQLAARNTGMVTSSEIALNATVTGMSARSSSKGTPSMLVITRGPSSSSTIAAT